MKNYNKRFCSYGIFLLCAASTATAAPTEYSLEPLLISASRIPTTLNNSLTNTTVITRQEIEARQASSVTELLRGVAGLHVTQAGTQGSIGSVYLRNGDPNFVTVLVDGVKVNDPTNSRGGSFDFSTLDIDSIERIEIVKGSLSSMYGSDALAGVINIVTRSVRQKPLNSVKLTAGSHQYIAAHGQTQAEFLQREGTVFNQGDLSLSLGYTDEGRQHEQSGFINRTANLSSHIKAGDHMKLKLYGRYNNTDAKSFPDDSGGEQYAVIREAETRSMEEHVLGLSLQNEKSSRWNYTISVDNFRHSEIVDSPGVAPGVRDPFGIPANSSDSTMNRNHILWSNTLNLSKTTIVNIGVDYQQEKGISNSALDLGGFISRGQYSLKRDNNGYFLESLYKPSDQWNFKAGLRYDVPQGFDHQFSPNLGALYRVKETTVTVNWGKAYKLPSFFALGNPIVGNPDLRPECSNFAELDIKQNVPDYGLLMRLNLFAYRYKDLVDFDAGPPPRMVNRSEVTAKGAEAEVSKQLSGDNGISANLAYIQTHIKDTDAQLRNRPKWTAGANFNHRIGNTLRVDLVALYVHKVYESSIPTGDVQLPAYYRFDAAIRWQPRPRWHLALAVDNLFDKKYQEAVGTNSPGRTLRVSAQLRI
jgi:vitamin B12 transporter